MRLPARLLVLSLLIGHPLRAVLGAQAPIAQASQQTVDNTPASARWNGLVPKFLEETVANRRAARKAAAAAKDSAALRRIAQSPPPFLFRVHTLLNLAQYAAVNSARDNRAVSSDAAVATASAAILTAQFPDSAVRVSIARELASDLEKARNGSRGAERAVAGQRLGEDIAARVTAWAPPPLALVAPWNGTIPTGPGMWYSAKGVPPIGIAVSHGRPWLLDSASQFRPGPPPPFDSPKFKAALEEVRQVARDRTADQTKLAQKWDSGDPWAVWNAMANDAIRRNRLSDADAVRVLAVLNVAASDAIVACFEAKYHYWTIRPSQADTTLVLADSIGLPNFPSYPSGHACSAGAFDAVLGHFFPQQRAEFTRVAEEQAMSRLYGGIHYRFDDDEGLALGRTVARYVVEREQHGAFNAWRAQGVAHKP
jgi:membrane-associated phospholipid phosphatase